MDNSFDEFCYKGNKEMGLQLMGQCQVKEVVFFPFLLMKVIYYWHTNEKTKWYWGGWVTVDSTSLNR